MDKYRGDFSLGYNDVDLYRGDVSYRRHDAHRFGKAQTNNTAFPFFSGTPDEPFERKLTKPKMVYNN